MDGAIGMNGAGNRFLARTAFTLHQHRMPAGRYLGNDAVQLLHLSGDAHHGFISGIALQMFAHDAVFQRIAQATGGADQQRTQLFRFERLADKVARAVLHGRNHGVHSGLAAQHDYFRLGMHLLEFCQQIQAVLRRLACVQQHDINGLHFHLPQGRPGAVRGIDLETHE